MTSKGLSWRMTGVSLTPLRYRPRPSTARRTRPGARPAKASLGLVDAPLAVGGQPTLPHLRAHLRQIIRASAVIDPHVRDRSPLIRRGLGADPGARVLGGYSPALQACDTLLDGGIDDDDGVKTVSVVALDEERNVVDGKRSCGCSTQDLPGATLDGRVGDRVESSDALVGTLTGEDTTREARPVKGPVLTDQIISESCGHLYERGPTGFENLTGNYVGIGDQCTQRLEGSGH